MPCSLPALCTRNSTSLGIADWTEGEHLAQRQSSVALAVVQRGTTGLPGETFQNVRCPIPYQMEILIYSISAGPLEVYFEKAVQLLLMGSPGKEPLSAGFKAVFPQRGSLYCVVIRQIIHSSFLEEFDFRTHRGLMMLGSPEQGNWWARGPVSRTWQSPGAEREGCLSEQKWAERCCVLRGAIRL